MHIRRDFLRWGSAVEASREPERDSCLPLSFLICLLIKKIQSTPPKMKSGFCLYTHWKADFPLVRENTLLITSPPKKVEGSMVQLKSICTNALSTGNKNRRSWKQLCIWKTVTQLETLETLWDDWGNWGAAVDGCKLVRWDRQKGETLGKPCASESGFIVWSLMVGQKDRGGMPTRQESCGNLL